MRGRLILLILAGCAPAHSAAPDDAEASVCPIYSGFSAVGTVWDYTVKVPYMPGTERSQLLSIDPSTGEVLVETAGDYYGGAFTYSFDRTDTYRCSEEGLDFMGWTSEWALATLDASFEDTSTGSWDPGIRLLLSDDEMDHPHELWTMDVTLWEADLFAPATTISTSFEFYRGEDEDLTVMGATVEAFPVAYQYSWLSDRVTSLVPWLWFSADLGIVRRGPAALESYSLGAGEPIE